MLVKFLTPTRTEISADKTNKQKNSDFLWFFWKYKIFKKLKNSYQKKIFFEPLY